MGDVLSAIGSHLGYTVLFGLFTVVILVGPIMFLAFLMQTASTGLTSQVVSLVGARGFIYGLGWIGVPVHEAGHWMMAVAFRHRIGKVRLFSPDPETGTLGYVEHQYNPRSLFQTSGNFFIGLGPVFSASLVLYLLLVVFFGSEATSSFAISRPVDLSTARGAGAFAVDTALGAFNGIGWFLKAELLKDWKLWVFIYLLLAIGSNIRLSRADMSGSLTGLITLLAISMLFNFVALFFYDRPFEAVSEIASLLTPVYGVLIMTLAGTTILFLIIFSLRRFAGIIRGR